MENIRFLIKGILNEEISSMNEITSKDAKNQFYQNVDDKLYGIIITLDPTYNPEKDIMGSYTKWLLRPDNLAKLKVTKDEDFYKIKDDLIKFNTLKKTNKLPPELRDINKFNLERLLDYIFDNYSDEVSTSKTQDIKNVKANVEKYDFPEWRVIVPKTEEAACYYGKGSKWCTAADNDNRFNQYNRQGKLWILINKSDPSEKYQLHFESGQYMDERDREYDLKELLETDSKLYDFFAEKYSFEICQYSIKNDREELFRDNYENKKFNAEQRYDIAYTILDRLGNCENDPYSLLSMLDGIEGINEMNFDKRASSDYGYTIDCIARNHNHEEDEFVLQNMIWFINIFDGIKDIDDVEVLYEVLYKNNPELFIEIIKTMNAGVLFKQFVNYNELESKVYTNTELIAVISDLKTKFDKYPVIENNIVKLEISDVDYETNKIKINLGLKNKRGKVVKQYSGFIDYKNIYKYITNYDLMMDSVQKDKPLV